MKAVPTAEFTPLLKQLLLQEDITEELLEEKSNIPAGTLKRILSQVNQTLTFDTADKLLCALGASQLWYGPLAHIYYDIDLEAIDKGKTYRDHNCPKHGTHSTTVNARGYTNCPVCNRESHLRAKRRIAA